MKKPWLEGIEVIDVNKAVPPWGGWFETLALTAVVLAASFFTQQQDPFRLEGGFPWAVLAPLLAGLRYGFVYAFVSALLILAMLGVAINQQWQAASGFPLAWAIGVVLVGMVAGEFRDSWGRRLHRLEGAYQYRAERLEEFTRSYQLLRLSHDRLEQTVANSGFSLREGIMRLQSELETIEGLTQASFARLLEFVAEYAALTQACIVGITGDRVDSAKVLAAVGDHFPIDDSDPVVRAALESGELAAVNLVKERAADQNTLLAAIPLADSTGDIHAILLVRAMPFFAFNEDNLKLIDVLSAHGVDHLRFGTATSSAARFIAAFERVRQDHARFGLDATLLRIRSVTGEKAELGRVYEKLHSAVRGIDVMCMGRDRKGDKADKGEAVIWILLPLTDIAGARAWMQREEGVLAMVKSEMLAVGDVDPQVVHCLER
jgi:polysaccharide biosynthesis protein PelD